MEDISRIYLKYLDLRSLLKLDKCNMNDFYIDFFINEYRKRLFQTIKTLPSEVRHVNLMNSCFRFFSL
jgi:uncharacterized protein YbgA (DUF1722 family)